MKSLSISPVAYLTAIAMVVGGLAAIFVAQLPELRRYMAIRSM